MNVPVITIDGPSGSGKGTIAKLLANSLGWPCLDSGAIYRAAAWALDHYQVDINDESAIDTMLLGCDIQLVPPTSNTGLTQVWCDGVEITTEIRQEKIGMMASTLSAYGRVRQTLLPHQRSLRVMPGLIADGRDMGTVVFPDANLKIYLNANQAARAQRRAEQLQAQGVTVNLKDIQSNLLARDTQDSGRQIAPLRPAADAYRIDTTLLNIDQVFAKVMEFVRQTVL